MVSVDVKHHVHLLTYLQLLLLYVEDYHNSTEVARGASLLPAKLMGNDMTSELVFKLSFEPVNAV